MTITTETTSGLLKSLIVEFDGQDTFKTMSRDVNHVTEIGSRFDQSAKGKARRVMLHNILLYPIRYRDRSSICAAWLPFSCHEVFWVLSPLRQFEDAAAVITAEIVCHRPLVKSRACNEFLFVVDIGKGVDGVAPLHKAWWVG